MPITLYTFPRSGHAHRAELMLGLLGIAYERVVVDLAGGENREPAFLALNPFGTVPVLKEDDFVLADSAAILTYLALTHDPARTWLPAAPRAAAEVQRFLSVAQGPVYNGPNMARLGVVFGRKVDAARSAEIAATLFAVLEGHLAGRDWLVGGGPTIADVACYSYIAHAPEGRLDLAPYPRLNAWLARIEALPGFVPMAKTPPQAA